MNYRTILLASAAVMFAAPAMAADLTNPFYLPGQGEFTSDTKVEYSRTKLKDFNLKADAWRASEEVAYGIDDNLSIFGTLGNQFDTEKYYNNDHNFDYEIGAAYNMQFDNVLAQVKGSYYTFNPKSFYGHHDVDYRWQKYINGEVKLGYDMGNGLVPYMSYLFEGQIDEADRAFNQSAFVGVHKYAGNWAVDGGIRYDFNTDGKNTNMVYAQAEVDYYPVENVALGIYGDYYLAGSTYNEKGTNLAGFAKIDRDYTTGVRAKVQF